MASYGQLKYENVSDLILKAFYKVYNIFGYGFLEKIYERALTIELNKLGLSCKTQQPIKVYYEQELIGN